MEDLMNVCKSKGINCCNKYYLTIEVWIEIWNIVQSNEQQSTVSLLNDYYSVGSFRWELHKVNVGQKSKYEKPALLT